MTDRHAHLVGSTPFANAAEAMDLALARLGPNLVTLPDGETGERRNWIIDIIESMRSHPDLEVSKDGDWSDYDSTPRFRVRRAHRLDGSTLDFGHVAAFESSWPLFEQRRSNLVARGVEGAADLAYQVGIPGDFDMALFTLGPVGALRNRRPFSDATVDEIATIFERQGDDVVFQIEVPAELVFVARFPSLLQPLVARWLARGIAALAARSPAGARFGLHLCLGDMNHRALGRLHDVTPLVRLSNAVVDAWPSGRSLEFVHAPLAEADQPPPSDQDFYGPLSGLRLPASTRFIAGLVHEDRSLEEQRKLLGELDELMGRPVDVATSCGLGRRKREPALDTLDRAADLCKG